MQRHANKPITSSTKTGIPRPRQTSFLRPPQQVVESQRREVPPDGLAPGVVRRVSAAEELSPTPDSVCDASEIPSGAPQPITPADFCRQARRLRAVHEKDPVRMHQQLSQLSVNAGTDEDTAVMPAPEVDSRSRKSTAIHWTWTQTARLGKTGVNLLGKLGRGLSMGAGDDSASPQATMEDDEPQYTLVDPEDPLPADQGYANTFDRNFAALVNRTLRSQHTSVLRYSQRLDLLKEAGRRGIGRFEANLIIASVQHRLTGGIPIAQSRTPWRIQSVLAFVLMQAMILWGFWRILKG